MRTSCAWGGATSMSSIDRSLPASQATAACSRSASPYPSNIRTRQAMKTAACGACISICGSARPAPQWTQRPWPARPNDGNRIAKEARCSFPSSVTYLASNGLSGLAMLRWKGKARRKLGRGKLTFPTVSADMVCGPGVKRENGYMSEEIEKDGDQLHRKKTAGEAI